MTRAVHPIRGPAKWCPIALIALALAGVAVWTLTRPSHPAQGVTRRVNLNAADRDELELIPGIGPVLAERILERRREAGPFRSLDDLGAIPGFDESRLEALRDHAIVR